MAAKFDVGLRIFVDRDMRDLVEQAAEREAISASAFARRALASALARAGYARPDESENPRRQRAVA